MKKKYCKGLVLILLITLVLASSASTQVISANERSSKFSSGLSFGVARFLDGDLDTGFSGRVFLEYAPYVPEIALKLSGGYLRFDGTVTLGQGAFSSKEEVSFEDFYLTGGLVYRFSRGKFVPFVTANLGVYHFQKEDVYPTAGPIVDGVQMSPFDTVKSSDGNDFGLNLGGGLEFFLNNRTSISLEVLLHSIQGAVNDEIFDVTAMFRFFPSR